MATLPGPTILFVFFLHPLVHCWGLIVRIYPYSFQTHENFFCPFFPLLLLTTDKVFVESCALCDLFDQTSPELLEQICVQAAVSTNQLCISKCSFIKRCRSISVISSEERQGFDTTFSCSRNANAISQSSLLRTKIVSLVAVVRGTTWVVFCSGNYNYRRALVYKDDLIIPSTNSCCSITIQACFGV